MEVEERRGGGGEAGDKILCSLFCGGGRRGRVHGRGSLSQEYDNDAGLSFQDWY